MDGNQTKSRNNSKQGVRNDGASPSLVTRPIPRRGGRRAKGSLARSKSVLTGQLQVSRNPFPSQTHVTRPSNLMSPGPVVINCPLQIVAIADWGQKFMNVGLNYPIPTFPGFLFTPLPESHQGGAQVPIKLSQVSVPRGDMHDKSREAWKWMVAVLQFWGDEASSTEGIVYGGREHPVSALAEYVFNTINPDLEPRAKITWDDVVI